MFSQLTIGQRIGGVFLTALVVAVATTAITMYRLIDESVMDAAHIELSELKENFIAQLDAEARRAESQADLIANIPDVQQAMAAGDRARLTQLLHATFKRQKAEYGIRQLQFHLPPATSMLRLHKLEKFGDDLSSFRQTVVEANRNRSAIRGLEKGVAGLGIRGVVPVSYQGQHIGSLEFGTSLGSEIINGFATTHGVDIGVFMGVGQGAKLLGSSYGEKPLLSEEDHRTAYENGDVVRHLAINGKPSIVMASSLRGFSGEVIGVIEVVHNHSRHSEMLAHARSVAIGISLLLVVLVLGVVVLMARSIACPIQKAVEAMSHIEKGDLGVRIEEVGPPELRRLAAGLNALTASTQGMVREVAAASQKIGGTADDLSVASQRTSAELQRESKDTEQVATALHQMGATAQEVASSAASAAEASHHADRAARSGNEIVSRAVASIHLLATEVTSSSESIGALQSQSQEIGGILDVIRTIAEQTNLLALNAAIEAARAGEQGRGFAVVADEVRTLASRTQSATQQIQQMIESLQSGARGSVAAMDRSQAQVHISVDEIQKAGDALREITKAVGTINEMNTHIATAAEEQTSVAEEINQNVSRISDATHHTLSEAQHVTSASTQLKAISQQLQQLITRFSV